MALDFQTDHVFENIIAKRIAAGSTKFEFLFISHQHDSVMFALGRFSINAFDDFSAILFAAHDWMADKNEKLSRIILDIRFDFTVLFAGDKHSPLDDLRIGFLGASFF